MDAPISPMIAGIFINFFVYNFIFLGMDKPKLWVRYVDDCFIKCDKGEVDLVKFSTHLNYVHSNIQFSIKRKNDGKLPFLDFFLKRPTA